MNSFMMISMLSLLKIYVFLCGVFHASSVVAVGIKFSPLSPTCR
jgi:hypothetical protein